MTLFGLQRGLPQTESANFAATTPVDILTASGPGKDTGLDVTQIIVSNNDSSARAVTISRRSGGADYPIMSAKSIPANDYILVECYIRLLRGDTIRVTPATANAMTVHINYVQPTS